jgi:hypothetical protein
MSCYFSPAPSISDDYDGDVYFIDEPAPTGHSVAYFFAPGAIDWNWPHAGGSPIFRYSASLNVVIRGLNEGYGRSEDEVLYSRRLDAREFGPVVRVEVAACD